MKSWKFLEFKEALFQAWKSHGIPLIGHGIVLTEG